MPPALNQKSPRRPSPSEDEQEITERREKRPRNNHEARINSNLGQQNSQVTVANNTTPSQEVLVDPSEYQRLKLEVEALRRAYHTGRSTRDIFSIAHNAATGFDRMSTREWLASWINGTSLILGEESSSYKNSDPCRACKEKGLVCFSLAENDKYYDLVCEEGYDCCGWCMRYTQPSRDKYVGSGNAQPRSASPNFQPGVASRQLQVMVMDSVPSAKIMLPTKLQYFVTGIDYRMTDLDKKIQLVLGDQAWVEPGDKFNHTTRQWDRGVWIGTSPEYPLMECMIQTLRNMCGNPEPEPEQAPPTDLDRRGPPRDFRPEPERPPRQTSTTDPRPSRDYPRVSRHRAEKNSSMVFGSNYAVERTAGQQYPADQNYQKGAGYARPAYDSELVRRQLRPSVYVRAPDRTPTPSAEAPPIPSMDNNRHLNSSRYQ